MLWLFILVQLSTAQPADQRICNKTFSFAFEHKLYEKFTGDVVISIGKEFLCSPYEPNTLDQADTECLVINLHSFDCVTFVENVLALSRCVKENRLSYEAFQSELQSIRYREGIANGYASRLHYFTDWIYDNEQKGIVKNITKELGGIVYKKKANFMTTHRGNYPHLTDDSAFSAMKSVEDSLSHRSFYYIPKEQIKIIESKIKSGDIIAITTNKEGLDIIHTGIAVRMDDGSLHYMHAPNVKGVVKITKETLWMHLKKIPSQTGIIVARPVEIKNK